SDNEEDFIRRAGRPFFFMCNVSITAGKRTCLENGDLLEAVGAFFLVKRCGHMVSCAWTAPEPLRRWVSSAQAQYPEHPYPSQHPHGAEGEEAQKGYEHGVFYMAHIDYVGVRRGGDRQAQAHQQAQSSMEFHSRNHHAFSPVLLKETLPLQWAI